MILDLALSAVLMTGGPPADRWLGEDKLRHFFASFMVTSLSASGARAAGLDHRQSLATGIGIGVAAGAWKEARDHARPGDTASVRDLVWDFAGVAAAAALVHQGRRRTSAADVGSGSQVPATSVSLGQVRGFTGSASRVY